MNERQLARWMATGVALVAFGAYWTTLCRTIYWGDGIELTSVAAVLGIAHPPGYPLFLLLGKAFAQLPLGAIGFRLNLMSATVAAALATLVAWTMWHLLPMVGLTEPDRSFARALMSAAAGSTVAFSKTIWYQAGLSEVYLLNAAIFAGVFLLIVLAVQRSQPSGRQWFFAAALLTGLAVGNHTTAVLLIPPLAVVGVSLAIGPGREIERRKRRAFPTRKLFFKRLVQVFGPALLLGILGMCIYAYLPLRAAKNPPLNWGDPSTLRGFLWTVRGGEFRNVFLLKAAPNVPFNSEMYSLFLRKRVIEWLTWTADQVVRLPKDQTSLRTFVGVLILVVAGVGWRTIARRRVEQVVGLSEMRNIGVPTRALAIVLPIIAVLNLGIVSIYTIPDIEGYFFPTHVIVVICLFVALAGLHRWTENRLLAHRSDVLAALFLALPAAVWFQGRSDCDHSRYDAAERCGREVLDRLAADAMILTQGDYDIGPLWYQQVIEHRRRDVVVLGSNFLATPAYAKYFEGRYDPPVAAQFFERTPYKPEYVKTVVEEIVAPNLQRRSLYATLFEGPLGPEVAKIELAILRDMGIQDEMIEIPALRDIATLDVPERVYFPAPYICRLQRTGVRP